MKRWLLLLVCLAASQAWAVNKCVGPTGKVSFQDAPCPGKGETLTVRPAAGASPAQAAGAAAADGAAPMTEAQRLNKLADDSQRERRRRDLLNRIIPGARASLDQHRYQCKETQARLEAQKYKYVQNLYGKTHAAQVSSEMAAAAAACDTRDRELKEQLEAVEQECAALGCGR